MKETTIETRQSSATHTPGPWIVFVDRDGAGQPIHDILPAMRNGEVASSISNSADADLIAAAPDLLKVAEMAHAVAAMEVGAGKAPDFGPMDLLITARLAIAKATGKNDRPSRP